MKKKTLITYGVLFILTMADCGISLAHDPYSPLALYVEGNYTKPSNNGLSVGDQLFASAVNAAGDGGASGAGEFDGGRRAVFLNPKNHYDYGFGLTYRFARHSRLFLDYDRYDSHTEQGDVDIRNICYVPPPNTYGFARVELHSYELRVGAIHHLRFNRFDLDLSAFFENAKLIQSLYQVVVQSPGDVKDPDSLTSEIAVSPNENKLHGFGPGVGIKAWATPFWLCPDWHLFVGGRGSVLVAHHHFTSSYIDNVPTGGSYIYDPAPSYPLIGKLDIEFGLNYHHALKREFHALKWDISLGMRYMNMFNAIKNGNYGGLKPLNVPNFGPNLGPAEDWGRYGPFLRFKLGGAES